MEHRLPAAAAHRPEIALSWHRAELSGLRTDKRLDRMDQIDVDRHSRLSLAAGPVLDEIADQLDGTRFCVLLADRDARLVDRRFGERRLADVLERISAVPGTRFDEASTGTNSIATVHELRKGVSVIGDEHYLESMRNFCCYGHPIVDPMTRRLEGVLDITGFADDASALLAPFLRRAALEIEQRLVAGSRSAQKHLLAAYQVATAHAVDPVVVFGDGVLLANQSAMEHLMPTDYVVLRAMTEDVSTAGVGSANLSLASGSTVHVQFQSVAGSGSGALIRLSSPLRSRGSRNRHPLPHRPDRAAIDAGDDSTDSELEQWRAERPPVLITGEPGTGRSTLARELVGTEPSTVLDALDVAGEDRFHDRLTTAAAAPGVVLLENLHLLPSALAARIRRLLAVPTAAWVIATGAPTASLDGEHAALAAGFLAQRELPPLRRMRADIPQLAAAMLRAAGAGVQPSGERRLTPDLVEALLNQSWPGNLRELQQVVWHLARTHSAGDLTVADLPAAYRRSRTPRSSTPLEQSERETIAEVLAACGGNKVQAARRLGISRATLYNRIRRLSIDG